MPDLRDIVAGVLLREMSIEHYRAAEIADAVIAALHESERWQAREAVVEAARRSSELTWHAGEAGEYHDVAIALRDALARLVAVRGEEKRNDG